MSARREFAAALVVAGTVLATVQPIAAQPYSGHGDYQVYCSSCHGAEARGDGVIANTLRKRPADLTQLGKRNNGVFPADRVFNLIDGRKGAAHSDSDMPPWGEVFAKTSESAGAEQTAARIETLVKYLATLQAK